MGIANISAARTTRRASKPSNAMLERKLDTDQAGSSVLELLQCPACGGVLTQKPRGAVVCKSCRASVAVQDGVLDFVAGAASTQLDDIDYDQFYAIDENHALITYNDIRTSAGALWPSSFGDALEIGCGTGGFSMAVVAKMPSSRVLLTDVSLKMLTICRRRLEQLPTVTAHSIHYATYSGREHCFRAGTFDTCFGTAVVHHVLDVQTFLGQVHDLLRPGGIAFFMEPNLRFHKALTATLAQLIAQWLRGNVVPDNDMSLMQNWMAEVHCNIVNTGDLEVLSDREDKHLFTSEGFEAVARDAGFGTAEALACHPDPTGLRTIENYLQQAGVTAETLRRLRQAWPGVQANFFGDLAPRDSAPSYVFWLRKLAQKRRRMSHRIPVEERSESLSARLWMTLKLVNQQSNPELLVEGWCLSDIPVKSVQIEIGDWRKRVPIWRPRPDVETLVNTDGAFSPLHALCSGIDARLPITKLPSGTNAVAVQVKILAVNGASSERGQVTVELDGSSQLVT